MHERADRPHLSRAEKPSAVSNTSSMESGAGGCGGVRSSRPPLTTDTALGDSGRPQHSTSMRAPLRREAPPDAAPPPKSERGIPKAAGAARPPPRPAAAELKKFAPNVLAPRRPGQLAARRRIGPPLTHISRVYATRLEILLGPRRPRPPSFRYASAPRRKTTMPKRYRHENLRAPRPLAREGRGDRLGFNLFDTDGSGRSTPRSSRRRCSRARLRGAEPDHLPDDRRHRQGQRRLHPTSSRTST